MKLPDGALFQRSCGRAAKKKRGDLRQTYELVIAICEFIVLYLVIGSKGDPRSQHEKGL